MKIYTSAEKAVQAAIAKAEELNIKITVAIVDDHGTPIMLRRMEGAIPVSPQFALSKAYTAAAVGLPTTAIAQYAIPGQPLNGITSAMGGKIMVIAGGLTIKHADIIVGGVGVGGSYDVSQDLACAQAALEAFE